MHDPSQRSSNSKVKAGAARGAQPTRPEAWLSSGQLCTQAGIKRGALRTYERLGLLHATQRSAAGYRLYIARDLDKLHLIRAAKALGLTLREVRELLPLFEPHRYSRAKLLEVTQRQLAAFDERLLNLQRVRNVLQAILTDPDRVRSPSCNLLAELEPQQPHTPHPSKRPSRRPLKGKEAR